MRALAVLFALLVPACQLMAAMHLHCALEHPLGRVTLHAAGEASHYAEHRKTSERDLVVHDASESAHWHADHRDDHGRHSEHVHGASGATTPFGDHHHHDGATGSHAGCCIGGAGGAVLCCSDFLGVDIRAEQFALPMPVDAYNSPYDEPPPRPQWPADAPA